MKLSVRECAILKKLIESNELPISELQHLEIDSVDGIDTLDLSDTSKQFHFASALSTLEWIQSGMLMPELLTSDQKEVLSFFKSIETQYDFVDRKTFTGDSEKDDVPTLYASSRFGDGDPAHYAALSAAHTILGLDLNPLSECIYELSDSLPERQQLLGLLQLAGFKVPTDKDLGKPITSSAAAKLVEAYKARNGLSVTVASPSSSPTAVRLNPGLQTTKLKSSADNVRLVQMGEVQYR
jgi:hypothetical protein